MARRCTVALASALVMAACSGGGGPITADSGGDAPRPTDAALGDGPRTDAPRLDAPPPDARLIDGPIVDGPIIDAAPVDAVAADAATDALVVTVDAPAVDAVVVDGPPVIALDSHLTINEFMASNALTAFTPAGVASD